MSLYVLPIVGRSGLGNMLLPWARAEIFARNHNARVLEPSWSAIRIGPYIRREPEKRRYTGFFRAPGHIRSLERFCVLLSVRHVSENEIVDADLRARSLIVTFRGLDNLFAPIAHEQPFIRDRLWNMTKPELRGGGKPQFIAIHVRRGDITRQGMTAEQLNCSPQYAPLSWYIAMTRLIRESRIFGKLPIVVFSDGSEDELKDLLAIDNVRLHARGPAIADMWTISRASLLIAGGASTFAMWASYLGAMSTIYAPGKLLQRVQAGQPEAREVEIGEGGPGLDAILPACANGLRNE